MGLITVKKKGYVRKGYVRKDGVRVKATKVKPSVFKVKDRGQKGRTPEAGQWYAPKVHMGWRKAQPMASVPAAQAETWRRGGALRPCSRDTRCTQRSDGVCMNERRSRI